MSNPNPYAVYAPLGFPEDITVEPTLEERCEKYSQLSSGDSPHLAPAIPLALFGLTIDATQDELERKRQTLTVPPNRDNIINDAFKKASAYISDDYLLRFRSIWTNFRHPPYLKTSPWLLIFLVPLFLVHYALYLLLAVSGATFMLMALIHRFIGPFHPEEHILAIFIPYHIAFYLFCYVMASIIAAALAVIAVTVVLKVYERIWSNLPISPNYEKIFNNMLALSFVPTLFAVLLWQSIADTLQKGLLLCDQWKRSTLFGLAVGILLAVTIFTAPLLASVLSTLGPVGIFLAKLINALGTLQTIASLIPGPSMLGTMVVAYISLVVSVTLSVLTAKIVEVIRSALSPTESDHQDVENGTAAEESHTVMLGQFSQKQPAARVDAQVGTSEDDESAPLIPTATRADGGDAPIGGLQPATL